MKPKNVLSEETVDIVFQCDAEGFPGPNVNWFKDGEVIHPSQFFVVRISPLFPCQLFSTILLPYPILDRRDEVASFGID